MTNYRQISIAALLVWAVCWSSGLPVVAAQDVVTKRGRLSSSDETLKSGEYRDIYTVHGRRGQLIVIDVQSTEFDTYVFLRGEDPDDEDKQWDNEDWNGDQSRSRIVAELPDSEEYSIYVTSHAAGETGRYTLEYALGEAALDQIPADGSDQEFEGSLSRNDGKLDSGEYRDLYQIEARDGQWVELDLTSEDFDPYVFARILGADENAAENDDFNGSSERAYAVAQMDRDGVIVISVTSNDVGEKGDYVLRVRVTNDEPEGAVSSGPESDPEDSGTPIVDGEFVELGELTRSDEKLDSGEYRDFFPFEWKEGQTVVVRLESEEFDPYVFVRCADDDSFKEDNDDYRNSSTVSQLKFVVPLDGLYGVYVTSSAPGERGEYELRVEVEDE